MKRRGLPEPAPPRAPAVIAPDRARIVGAHVEHWLRGQASEELPVLQLSPRPSDNSPIGDAWTLVCAGSPRWPARWVNYLADLRIGAVLTDPAERTAALNCRGVDFVAESDHVLSFHANQKEYEHG